MQRPGLLYLFCDFCIFVLARNNETATTITFNKFQKHWINNEIKVFEVKEDKMTVSGNLKDGTQYETIVPFERLNQFISAHDKMEML